VLVLTILDAELTREEQCTAIREELLEAIEQGTKKILVDFQHVKYVSSVAFRPLLSLRRRVHEIEGRLVLCNLAPPVADVFKVTRLLINSRSSPALFEEQTTVAAGIACLNESRC
jgi:anti-anti-sigma factor